MTVKYKSIDDECLKTLADIEDQVPKSFGNKVYRNERDSIFASVGVRPEFFKDRETNSIPLSGGYKITIDKVINKHYLLYNGAFICSNKEMDKYTLEDVPEDVLNKWNIYVSSLSDNKT